MRSSEGVGRHISMRPGHAEGRRHSLPAMTGLAREVGYLVHGKGEDGSLGPLEQVEGVREEWWMGRK